MKKASVWFLCFALVMSVAVSGCAKKGSGSGASSLKSEDIPLDEANISFSEPAGIPLLEEDIHYDYNKSNIRADAKPILEGVASWMNQNPNKYIMIEGHCDDRGSKEYNLALGEQRALSARRYLVDLGIEAKRVHTISYGEESPIDTGSNEAAYEKNRRGHFLISR